MILTYQHAKESPRHMAQRTLYLIRHGQYTKQSHNDELGGILTELGQYQAQLVGEVLSHLHVSTIHCSSMRRAQETADIIASMIPKIKPHPTKLLWELIPTIPQHLADYFETLAQRNPQFSPDQVIKNRRIADEAFETFFQPASRFSDQVIIVCHGNLIRYLVCQALGIDSDKWSNMLIHHCSITSILIEDNTDMTLVSYNETGHLPQHIKTER